MTDIGAGMSSREVRRRPGGRSARVTQSVLRATLEVLAASGWEGFQIEAVAERAGVHKTTIYRRWETRGALVAAAMAATPFRSLGATVPDIGTVRDDLGALAADMKQIIKVPRTRRIIRALSAGAGDPELAAANRDYYDGRQALVAEIVRRGVERGEVPPATDADLIATIFVSAIRFHVVDRGIDPPDEWFDALVDATLRAADIRER